MGTNNAGGLAYRLIGSFSTAQWTTLMAGQQLFGSQLTPIQQQLIRRMADLAPNSCEREEGQDPSTIPDQLLTGTEAMPTGIPATLTVGLSQSDSKIIGNRKLVSGNDWTQILNAPKTVQELAPILKSFSKSAEDVAAISEASIGFGMQNTMTLKIVVRKGVRIQSQFKSKALFLSQSDPNLATARRDFLTNLKKELGGKQ